MAEVPYDALLLLSFGGPESPDEVLPFLENVLRGRNVPRERMLEVAEHYSHCGGRSPINDQNRALIAALQQELAARGPQLPIYWGNRNWHPLLPDTMRRMQAAGVQHALVFVTSAYSSYSGCRQYREDVARAREVVGPAAPVCDKLRVFFNHPGFIEAMSDWVRVALQELAPAVRSKARLVFTAHSIPESMAASCDYVVQVRESSRLVAARLERPEFDVVYQSRSGPPTQPWLGPDVNDHLRDLARRGEKAVVLVPIGFVSDHMEVVFDLDTEARESAAACGLPLVRAATVGTHPAFVGMIRDLIGERIAVAQGTRPERPALGVLGARADTCAVDCCPAPMTRGGRP